MAEIKMSYIFIEKEKNESKTMKEILLERVDNVVQMRNKNDFKVDDIVITYRIIQRDNSKRCFLELICKERVNRCISALKKVDASFFVLISKNIIILFEIMMGFQKAFASDYTLSMQNLREI